MRTTLFRRAVGLLGSAVLVLCAAPAASAAEEPVPNIRATIEVAPEEQTDSSLIVYFKVKVLDAVTGQLRPERYEVYVTPQDSTGLQKEIFSLLPRDATYHDEPPGVYGGLVYFSNGGRWKVNAVVNKYVSDIDKIENKALRNAPPVTYARASMELDVVGEALESSGREAFFGKDPRSRPTWDGISIGVLWIHTLAASAWGFVVVVLLLLAVPFGRRLLSDRGCNFFDQRLGLLTRTNYWITAVIIGTGIYNLLNTIYETPFTPSKARQVFLLPYGKPYFVTLFVKLLMYALMLGAVFPVMKQARLRANAMSGSRPEGGGIWAGDAFDSKTTDSGDPWASAGTSRRARRAAGGATAVVTAPAPVPEGAVATMAPAPAAATLAQTGESHDGRGSDEEETSVAMKTSLAVLVLGVPVLFLAVTILKDLHGLIEAIRYWTYWTSGS